jgi:hypothetical protein
MVDSARRQVLDGSPAFGAGAFPIKRKDFSATMLEVRESGMQSAAVFTILIVFARVAAGQNTGDNSNVSCIARLDVPSYPSLAAKARRSATVAAAVDIGFGGAIQGVTTDVRDSVAGVEKLFVMNVENSLRASKFAPTCNGRTVRLKFQFLLGDHVTGDRVSFAYPNLFLISAPTKTIQ